MSKPAEIFWTGGWDSTFQMLKLLFIAKVEVQPLYYVGQKKSTQTEIETMDGIRSAISREHPQVSRLLLPTKYISLDDLAENREITMRYERLRDSAGIGIQYDLLARICEQHGLRNVQLCVHQDDRAHSIVGDIAVASDEVAGGGFTLDAKFAGSDAYELFRYYDFPVLEMTKLEMGRLSKKYGFDSVMNMTWFCHSPRGGKPCGTCNPCRYTIEEGLGWRVSLHRRNRVLAAGTAFGTRLLAKAGLGRRFRKLFTS